MFDYKTLKKVIVTLAVLFGVDLAVLVLSIGAPNHFTIAALLIMLLVGIYFTFISLRLLKELRATDPDENSAAGKK